MKTKLCGKCNVGLCESEFSKNKDGKDGLRSNCKKCCASTRRKYKAREKYLVLEKAFPGCITCDSEDKRIDEMYHNVQMSNLSNGYIGLKASDPMAIEVDHIKPLSKGGLHVFSNLQVLTVSENRSKKDSK